MLNSVVPAQAGTQVLLSTAGDQAKSDRPVTLSRPNPDLIVVDTHQEHGVIAHRSGGKAPSLPVGTRLRILPNYACATGAQHEGYNVVEWKREVLARWERFSGW